MVVVIIGIIAAIAVPRVAGASKRATANALLETVENVRTAIDCYYAEHDRYPGYNVASGLREHAAFPQQLMLYTSPDGTSNATPSLVYNRGPYLRTPFPANPFNKLSTVYVKALPSDPDPGAGTYGWVAVLSHGYFGVLADDTQLEDVGIDPDKDSVRGDAILSQ